jgi:hypothetical protein
MSFANIRKVLSKTEAENTFFPIKAKAYNKIKSALL